MMTLKESRGYTLLEMSIVLAISAILVVPLSTILISQMRVPVKISAELESSRQVQNAIQILADDALVARSFSVGTDPDYGTFSWFEFSAQSPIPVTARYVWEDGAVAREVVRQGETTTPQVLITGVAEYGDVTFEYTAPAWAFDSLSKSWSYTEGKIVVTMTTTHDAGAGFDDIVSTSTVSVDFRPQLDLPAPLPDRLVPPAPPANLVEFRIAGDPNLLLGVFVSGSGTDLTFDDDNYYIARATGAPRTLSYEATSEVVDYATGTDITIEFTGRVDRAGITQQIFVHNPNDPAHTDGGYDTTPDIASVYSAKDTDQTVIFALSDEDVAYFNSLSSSTKAIKIKVTATDPQLFRLSSDRLVYKVAGQPNPSFTRDYLVEGDPAVEAGDHITGDAGSLQTDDTDYYEVRDVALVVQWTVVSEAITLDAISSLEIIFTGRAVNNTSTQGLFVFNPAHGGDGFDSTADLETTYSSTGTDETVSFFLNAADLAYVNSLFPKEVRLRLKGTHATSQFRIQADQIVFRAKP